MIRAWSACMVLLDNVCSGYIAFSFFKRWRKPLVSATDAPLPLGFPRLKQSETRLHRGGSGLRGNHPCRQCPNGDMTLFQIRYPSHDVDQGPETEQLQLSIRSPPRGMRGPRRGRGPRALATGVSVLDNWLIIRHGSQQLFPAQNCRLGLKSLEPKMPAEMSACNKTRTRNTLCEVRRVNV